MTWLICGGRYFDDFEMMINVLNFGNFGNPDLIIHGGAKGADQLAEEWAQNCDIPTEVFHADWDTYGKRAGYIRNKQMAEQKPDLVIAFPGGRGTEDMVRQAKKAGLKVIVVKEDGSYE